MHVWHACAGLLKGGARSWLGLGPACPRARRMWRGVRGQRWSAAAAAGVQAAWAAAAGERCWSACGLGSQAARLRGAAAQRSWRSSALQQMGGSGSGRSKSSRGVQQHSSCGGSGAARVGSRPSWLPPPAGPTQLPFLSTYNHSTPVPRPVPLLTIRPAHIPSAPPTLHTPTPADEHFRVVYDAKGRFVVHRITKEEAGYKLCKVRLRLRLPRPRPCSCVCCASGVRLAARSRACLAGTDACAQPGVDQWRP